MRVTNMRVAHKFQIAKFVMREIELHAEIEEGDNIEDCFIELDDTLLHEEARIKASFHS